MPLVGSTRDPDCWVGATGLSLYPSLMEKSGQAGLGIGGIPRAQAVGHPDERSAMEREDQVALRLRPSRNPQGPGQSLLSGKDGPPEGTLVG